MKIRIYGTEAIYEHNGYTISEENDPTGHYYLIHSSFQSQSRVYDTIEEAIEDIDHFYIPYDILEEYNNDPNIAQTVLYEFERYCKIKIDKDDSNRIVSPYLFGRKLLTLESAKQAAESFNKSKNRSSARKIFIVGTQYYNETCIHAYVDNIVDLVDLPEYYVKNYCVQNNIPIKDIL